MSPHSNEEEQEKHGKSKYFAPESSQTAATSPYSDLLFEPEAYELNPPASPELLPVWQSIMARIRIAHRVRHPRTDDSSSSVSSSAAASESLLPPPPCNDVEPAACFLDTIERDLRPWNSSTSTSAGITEHVFRRALNNGVLYQMINGTLYRDRDCLYPQRCFAIEHYLHRVMQKLDTTRLPIEFVVNDRDWPVVPADSASPPAPVFSYSKNPEKFADIRYPTWAFVGAGPRVLPFYPDGIGKWEQWRHEIADYSETRWPWHLKRPTAYFRGARSNPLRDPLVMLSRGNENHTLFDAEYTQHSLRKKAELDTLGEPAAEPAPFKLHCQYAYLFNFADTEGASSRLRHLFLCRSLVVHVGNESEEFFQSALRPWIHYVPVSARDTAAEQLRAHRFSAAMRADIEPDEYSLFEYRGSASAYLPDAEHSENSMSYLRALVLFFRSHDLLAERIANEGARLILRHLRDVDIEAYWTHLLCRYGELLRYRVQLREDRSLFEIPPGVNMEL